MKIKTLLIGLGNIGMLYDDRNSNLIQSHAKAVELHPNFKLVSGIDPVYERRNFFEENYKLISFKRLDEFRNKDEIDLVIISTPTDTHLCVIEETIKSLKPKMILCEKPLSYDYNDAFKIVDLCKKANIELFVNFVRRCDPAVIEIKNKIDQNLIEPPLKGICWYSKGLYNNGSHFINLLEYWLGNYKDIRIINSGRVFNNIDPEPEFIIDFQKGSIIFRSAWEENFSFYKVEIISKSGILKYENGGDKVELYHVEDDKKIKGYKILSEKKLRLKSKLDVYQYMVLDQIYKSYLGENTTICKGSQALSTQKIIYSIREKLRT
ncbi:Gfo/Idh/MocA family protein [Prochlorococcus sp. MIT 0604]|uniref:Gfo/Idh/MocA family protein n=1 Tax=Prochlorococcus sp. MIT 0604 TaxID=1501268 RepID=UPI0004F6BF92|nr:Gfo/Idh/MocA family oxidoreductase [Prochlorococcus sp. MIT 0604]AIQ95503.1 putative myo-inositol dehydrogenase protein [Prochlorococcus sp. MIT 0604]